MNADRGMKISKYLRFAAAYIMGMMLIIHSKRFLECLNDGFCRQSGNHPAASLFCLCYSADLYPFQNNYYFIKVTEEDTVLGRQLRAEYVSVNLIECNDEFAAVYGNVSEHDKIVVRASMPHSKMRPSNAEQT